MAKGKAGGKGSRTIKSSSTGGRYRSAITGKYVSSKYGKSHPKTTVKEAK